MEHLEFENGNLVKWKGQRPDYMDGYRLIELVRLLGAEVCTLRAQQSRAAYHLGEIDGCLHEYEAMPCRSLRVRLRTAVNRAKERTR